MQSPATGAAERWTLADEGPWPGLLRAGLACAVAVAAWQLAGGELLALLRLLRPWSRPSVAWAAMGTVLLCFRTLLWLRYRPAPPATTAEAPALTVIIPAYNEGPMVARSIESVVAADYPRDRLEVLVIDDGSTDDTWEHMAGAARRHPGLVSTIRFDKNYGKRAGLEAGFRRARGEIVVTIDSDSVIDRGSLLAMAGAFRDPRVGAVAGRVAVYNRTSGLLPRMLDVRFLLSFDLLRAVQSVYGTVYCCPGALAGYRASVVR